jgi:hypothetical protein
MNPFALAAISGVSLAAALMLAQIVIEKIRSRRTFDLDLKPNCLLTRYPVVFMTGERSLFYFRNYWNQVPDYLAEHGYAVEILELPWRGRQQRIQAAIDLLRLRDEPCHLIADSSQNEELTAVWKQALPQVVSATIASVRDLNPHALRPRGDGVQMLQLAASKQLTLKAVFLELHNLLSGRQPIEREEVGANAAFQHDPIENLYLEYAISLAERDSR